MNLSELTNETDKLPSEQKHAILKIIDLKISQDMKEIIQAIEHSNQKFEQAIKYSNQQIKYYLKIFFWILGIVGAAIITGITLFVSYIAYIVK